MSIVYDYLKRIQEQKEPVRPVPSLLVQVSRKKGRFSFFLVAGILFFGMAVVVLLYLIFSQGQEMASFKLYRPRQQAIQRPLPVTTPDTGYVLEGIIYNPDRPFAIINGQMLERDGNIGDCVVTSITPNTVSLKNTKDGTGRTLQL